MTTIYRTTIAQAIAAVAAIICSCATGSPPTQAGSETTSGIEIEALGATIRGTTTPDATVMIFDARYVPGDTQLVADTVTPDKSGFFAFNDLPAGEYNLYIFAEDTLTKGAVMFGIPVMSNRPDGRFEDSAQLSPLRAMSGTATYQGQPDSRTEVFIAGSPFYTKTDSQGRFGFQEVPFGAYTVVARLLVRSQFFSDSASVDFSQTEGPLTNVVLELR